MMKAKIKSWMRSRWGRTSIMVILSLVVLVPQIGYWQAVSAAPNISKYLGKNAFAVINPSGTHIQKGYLVVRIDLYPSPSDKTWNEQYIDQVDESGIPTGKKQLNPFLCYFIAVPEDITQPELQAYISTTFDEDTLATLNNILIQEDSAHLVSVYAKTLPNLASQPVKAKNKTKLIDSTNNELSSTVVPFEGGGSVIPIEPQTIDVGDAATNRGSVSASNTLVSKGNPANATGTIDTIEIWAGAALENCEVATFFVVSGNNLSTRDSELIGSVTAGSKQTFTLNSVGGAISIDVETGDYIGSYFSNAGGQMEVDESGGSGVWYVLTTDLIPCTNQAFTALANYAVSLYGTGTEAGGATIPTVVTGSSLPSTTWCLVSGNVTATGGANVTSWGTNYGLTAGYGYTVTNNGTEASPFGWSDNLTSLDSGTLYHYRSWATNSEGTGYGDDDTFTTDSVPSGFIPRILIY